MHILTHTPIKKHTCTQTKRLNDTPTRTYKYFIFLKGTLHCDVASKKTTANKTFFFLERGLLVITEMSTSHGNIWSNDILVGLDFRDTAQHQQPLCSELGFFQGVLWSAGVGSEARVLRMERVVFCRLPLANPRHGHNIRTRTRPKYKKEVSTSLVYTPQALPNEKSRWVGIVMVSLDGALLQEKTEK